MREKFYELTIFCCTEKYVFLNVFVTIVCEDIIHTPVVQNAGCLKHIIRELISCLIILKEVLIIFVSIVGTKCVVEYISHQFSVTKRLKGFREWHKSNILLFWLVKNLLELTLSVVICVNVIFKRAFN
nr:MAG TPA: hypothetical protein [Caudoviricetes sp.]